MYVCDDVVYFLYYNSIVKYYIETNECEAITTNESKLIRKV